MPIARTGHVTYTTVFAPKDQHPTLHPLLVSIRRRFNEDALAVFDECLTIRQSLRKISKKLAGLSDSDEIENATEECHVVFHEGWDKCRQSFVEIIRNYHRKLTRIGSSHDGLRVDDPASWASARMAELLNFDPTNWRTRRKTEFLTLRMYPQELPVVARMNLMFGKRWLPFVAFADLWFRRACDGGPNIDSMNEEHKTGYREPWCAPAFTRSIWVPAHVESRLTAERTRDILNYERVFLGDQLERALIDFEDEARIELATTSIERTTVGQIHSKKPNSTKNAPRLSASEQHRRQVIWTAINEGREGPGYCTYLEENKIFPNLSWVREKCPRTYKLAYKIPKWRKRINQEKWLYKKRMVELQQEKPSEFAITMGLRESKVS